MQIGSMRTKAGAERVTLEFWARGRHERPYPRRVVRLTQREYEELRAKIFELASAGELKSQLAYMGV